MDAATEAMLDKVAKLRAKANDAAVTEAEAALFMAKVAELLAQHNLTEAMLNARDASREQGPIGTKPFGQRVPDAWRERILMGVARLYYCRVTFGMKGSKANPHDYRLSGRDHNVVVAAAMAEYLFATVKRMAREYSPISREQKDYRKGAGDRLYRRLWDMAEAQRRPIAADPSNGVALMVISEDKALDDYLGDIKSYKAKGHRYGESARDGWEEAGNIGLNTQVAETRAERMLT